MPDQIREELRSYQQEHSVQEQAWLVLQRWRQSKDRGYLEHSSAAVLREMLVLIDDPEQQQQLLRFGPRVYTDEQWQRIQEAPAARKKLPVEPIPLDDQEQPSSL